MKSHGSENSRQALPSHHTLVNSNTRQVTRFTTSECTQCITRSQKVKSISFKSSFIDQEDGLQLSDIGRQFCRDFLRSLTSSSSTFWQATRQSTQVCILSTQHTFGQSTDSFRISTDYVKD